MDERRTPLILDLHIPYCIWPDKYLGHYNALGTNEQKNMYLTAMMREVRSWEGELENYEIRAVRLGGGSATVMKPDLLGELLTLVRHTLPLAKGAEVSFDALPNTIGTPSLSGIAAGHPTRAELMMRSENDEELQTLACPFRMEDTQNAMLFFQKFHLNNVSLTVNYGIPGQTPATWHNTLHACEIMRPEHIRIAPLAETGAEGMPDEETRFAMYDHACGYLGQNGYRQYAAGHFSLPYHKNLFDVLKMDGTACLGMGVSAVSVMDGYVTRNTNNIALYVKNAGDFEKVTTRVYTADADFMMDRYVNGRLQTVDGLSQKRFEEKFECPLPDRIRAGLEERTESGLLGQKEDAYIPTRRGLFAMGI